MWEVLGEFIRAGSIRRVTVDALLQQNASLRGLERTAKQIVDKVRSMHKAHIRP